jgi:hypothetical protein
MALNLFGSGAASDAAGANQQAALQALLAGQYQSGQYQAGAIPAIQAGQAGALGALGGAQTGGVSALTGGQAGALGALGTGLSGQLDAYNAALARAIPAAAGIGAAYAPVSNLAGSYGAPVNLALGALGAQGPDAQAAARSAFTASPGYQFQVNEATRAAENAAAATGTLGSGNTLDAIRSRAQGFASQDYNSWLNNLLGFTNPQLQATTTAAGGQAQGASALTNLLQNWGTQTGGAYGAYGPAAAGVYSGTGSQVANLLSTLGQGQAGVYTGGASDISNVLGNVLGANTQGIQNYTSADIAANNLKAQAASTDAANFWNLIGNLGGAAVKGAFPAKPA